jgi:hypothetical protein
VLGLLRDHAPRSVTYIALGPLTNLAQTLRTDGACVRERIGRVVIMGGALDVPGNTSPSAECAHHLLPFLGGLADGTIVHSQSISLQIHTQWTRC